MRILHTSDWHIGRTFHGHDLLADQEQALCHLADMVRAEGVDVVVVAGDIYDRALPAAESVRVYDRVLLAIRRAGARIVLISGNHDSPARLGCAAGFTAEGGLHLHTAVDRCATPTVLADDYGDVAFYGLPYLEPDTARAEFGPDCGRGHEAVLRAAMDSVRADLAARPAGTRSVVLAHAFVMGAAATPQTSDSERSLSVGGVQTAGSDVFDGVDYVALGHLHGMQQPDSSRPWLRYSGSPLAYSFSEIRQRKSVLLVDLDIRGLCEVRRVELPVPRRLRSVSGLLADLLTDPGYDHAVDDYLQVILTDPVRPVDAMRRLQTRFPYAVALQWEPLGAQDVSQLSPELRRPTRADVDAAADFVRYVRESGPTPGERALLDAAFGSLRLKQAAS